MSVVAFVAELNAFADDLEKHLNTIVQQTAFTILENIIVGGKYSPGSPVDTGFFRASWLVTIAKGEMGMFDEPGPAVDQRPAGAKSMKFRDALGEITLVLLQVSIMTKILFHNSAVYGERLEYGHSGQAPEGMVRITVVNGQAIVDDVVRRVQTKL